MPRQLGDTRETSEVISTVDRDALRAQSVFVGNVGDELELDVRVNHISDGRPSNYGGGDRHLFLLGDEDRNAIRLWSERTFRGPGGLKVSPQKGDRFRLRATVKSHEEYKGEKQTTISKPTILAAL